jgi:predicted Zn-dependent protease
MGLVNDIVSFGSGLDLLMDEIGVSSSVKTQVDTAVTTLEGAAQNENPVVVAAAFGIAVVAVDAIGPELLAAGVTAVAGEEAIAGAAYVIDQILAQEAPALFALTSGTKIVGTTSASIGGIVAGATIQQLASTTLSGIANLFSSLSSPNEVSTTTTNNGTLNIGAGDANVFSDNGTITVADDAAATVSGTGNIISVGSDDDITLIADPNNTSGTGSINTVKAASSSADLSLDTITFEGESIETWGTNGINSGSTDSDGKTYKLTANTLTITKGADSLIINGFQNGDFGVIINSSYNFILPLPGHTPDITLDRAVTINDSGEILGNDDVYPNHTSYLDNNGTITTVNYLGSSFTNATDLNNSGQIIGVYTNGNTQHGFIDSSGVYSSFDIPNSTECLPLAINNLGQIIGKDDNGSFLYDTTTGAVTAINAPGSAAGSTETYGINDFGQVVGSYDYIVNGEYAGTNGFLYDIATNTYTTIELPASYLPPGDTLFINYLVGINDEGQAIGNYTYSTASGNKGGSFLYDIATGSYSIIDPSVGYIAVQSINNHGQIIGTAIDANGNTVVEVANPIDSTTAVVQSSNVNNQTVNVSANSNAQVTGNSNTINGSSNDSVSVSGNSDIITIGSGSYASVNGSSNTVTASNGDTIYLSGNGQGAINIANTVNMSNGAIYIGASSTEEIVGNNNTITSSNNDNLVINGNGNNLTSTSNDAVWITFGGSSNTVTTSSTGNYVDISGNGQVAINLADTVNTSRGTIDVGYQSTAQVVGNNNTINGNYSDNMVLNGNGNTLSANSGSYVWLTGTGSSNTVTLANGDYVSLGGNGQVAINLADNVHMSSGTIAIGYNSTANITGSNNTINGNYSDNFVINGGGNTVTMNTGDYMWLGGSGIGNNITAGNGDYIDINGNGVGASDADTIHMSSGSIEVDNNSTASVVGNSNTITALGTNDVIVSGTGNVINAASGDTITVVAGSSATINGSNLNIVAAAGDNITLNGTAGTNHITGSGAYTLTVNGVNKGNGNNYGTYGFAGDPSVVAAALDPNSNAIVQNDLADGNLTGAAAAQASLQQLQDVISTGSTASVLEGAKWDSNVITWSAEGNLAAYQGDVQAAFNAWGTATGLTFEEVSNPSQADINLEFSDLNTPTSGIAGYTNYTASNGQMDNATIQIEDPNQDALVDGTTYSGTSATLQQTLEHEIGHALGFADNNNPNSIMDYYLSNRNQTLSSNDVVAAQSLYGTSPASASTETSYLQLIQAMASFGTDTGAAASPANIPEPYMLTGTIIANPMQPQH